MISLLVLLAFTRSGTARFWWVLAAFISLVMMQLIYWIVTHPVNSAWLKGKELKGLSTAFFSFGVKKDRSTPDWTKLRDAWEYSHVARTVFAMLSLIFAVIAVAI
jgi:hypothetical protein